MGKMREKSLGTPDRTEAEIAAADEIKTHKMLLLLCRNKRNGTLKHEPAGPKYTPGLHPQEDGTFIYATPADLTFMDANGRPIRTEPNEDTVTIRFTAKKAEARQFPAKPKVHPADDIIDHWANYKKRSHHIVNEARRAWEAFKEITDNKPLAHCGWDDTQKLAERLRGEGNKGKTIEKKIGHLRAAVNLSIKTRKLKIANPFLHASVDKDDGIRREPLSEAEMALVRDNLHKLSAHDQLLWKWLACTGMRLSEPFQIDREQEENGVRFVIVGTKTDSSLRRVPIPTELRPGEAIEKSIFVGDPETVGKRLRYFLRKLGISHDAKAGTGNPAKVIHSLRHRAKDRLRAGHCPKDIQLNILGHDEVTVADNYGAGYPMDVLLPYVDKIGW